ncbi:MAG: RNA polymerase factor sigma-54 [Bacteroidota bacterium]
MQKLGLKQKQQGKLSPKQVQFVQLLQVPTEAMATRIQEELDDNPTLEVEASEESLPEQTFEEGPMLQERGPYTRRRKQTHISEEMLRSELGTVRPSWHEKLLAQLSLLPLSEREALLAHYLVGSLADDGYLRTHLAVIMHNLSSTHYIETDVEELSKVLAKIQEIEPVGIGARDLQECLLLQLKRKSTSPAVKLATAILSDCFDAFSKKNYKKIASTLKLSQVELKEALNLITQLSPQPIVTIEEKGRTPSRPDFLVQKNATGELEVSLYHDYTPTLRVRKQYRDMLTRYAHKKDPKAKEVTHFVREKMVRAQWFIESIRKRRETLLNTMRAIVKLQQPFFSTQDEEKLRPLFMRHIAEEIGMDISTVSRVVSKKSVQTDMGTFPLKYFFSESINTTQGTQVSSRIIKEKLRQMIEAEDKEEPYTDEELVARMKSEGYLLARRTIAKYRSQLGIPTARMRRTL